VGTAVAKDIDLVVESGARVTVIDKADSKRPRPPGEPIADRDPLGMTPTALASLSFRPPAIAALDLDVSSRVETFEAGFRITAHIPKLKHTVTERLGPFVLIFPSVAAIAPLTMHFQLNSESLLENLEGNLHVVAAAEST
jgi:hypothetical protein